MSWSADIDVKLGDFHLQANISTDAKVLAVVGPNGSGKSTMLRSLLGALGATFVLNGESLGDLPIERRGIGFVPQGYRLFPHLNVFDNVAFGLQLQGADDIDRTTSEMLRRLDIEQLAYREIDGLSGGERQRVALARALVCEPKMLLLDEPLAALDAIARREVRSFLSRHLRQFDGYTVLVTHDVEDVLALKANVCVLIQGKVVQIGDIKALEENPAHDFVGEFLGLSGSFEEE